MKNSERIKRYFNLKNDFVFLINSINVNIESNIYYHNVMELNIKSQKLFRN